MNNDNTVIAKSVANLEHSYVDTSKNRLVYNFIKRLFDIVFSLIALIILLPFFLIIAILIKLDSKGPVFVPQLRVGKDGKLFRIWKFRSMINHAEEILLKWLETNPEVKEEYLTNKKLKNDPRVTRIGKFIRKTSIDELPQLINVFLGNMSLVGPRPYLMYEKDDMGICFDTIIRMKPGITGPWQVAGRNNISFAERCLIDTNYYRERSIKKDIKILFKTVIVVIKKIGVY